MSKLAQEVTAGRLFLTPLLLSWVVVIHASQEFAQASQNSWKGQLYSLTNIISYKRNNLLAWEMWKNEVMVSLPKELYLLSISYVKILLHPTLKTLWHLYRIGYMAYFPILKVRSDHIVSKFHLWVSNLHSKICVLSIIKHHISKRNWYLKDSF
jgi:hypothetical protein